MTRLSKHFMVRTGFGTLEHFMVRTGFETLEHVMVRTGFGALEEGNEISLDECCQSLPLHVECILNKHLKVNK